METILLVIHLLLAVALIAVILLQRSEGGGLGIGGGSSSAGGGFGGMMSARGAANFLTRTTAILATAFMGTSLLLAIIATDSREGDFLDQIEGAEVFSDIRIDEPRTVEPPPEDLPQVDAEPEVPLAD
ncbi:MAG: preprotein translocase subunit SecG [Pseudomonadota bacterium]